MRTITLTITDDHILLDAKNGNQMVWQGGYEWATYGVEGTVERALRGIPEWLIKHAPKWVSQWESASAQDSHA